MDKPPTTCIALIAHDEKKDELVAFCKQHHEQFAKLSLIGTGTTSARIREETSLEIRPMLSGPLGGDAQIASLVATNFVHAVIFIVDPLTSHPHDPDIQGLQRVCNVHNIPLATNLATAEIIVNSLTDPD
ncbi:MAG: methylglyoxal synthase [Rhodospirillales bacterium]|nr:methylglyoxal synthase [Rhodospirillales bacterium]